MLVLGIETTCDETACAIVRNGREILANVVTSQIDLHSEYGGVVPELACRRHVDILLPVINGALETANLTVHEIDLIAVAHGPGLIGALLVGLTGAKALSFALGKPYIGVNHIEAHLYAAMMNAQIDIHALFPAIGVVLSGGHTSLVLMHGIGSYELIGQTIDDAIGEAFDKVAKILNLPYPGGPEIEKLARLGDPTKYPFKLGVVKNSPFDFSFSGLKTAVLYTVKGQNSLGTQDILPADVAASFQRAAFADVSGKTLKAAERHSCHNIVFGGGVTNNKQLRHLFSETNPNFNYIWPEHALTMDNAAMIAGLGYHRFLAKQGGDPMELEALTSIPF